MKRLGVNIDHIATLRNARGEFHPDPFYAAKFVNKLGADSITIHLREDRRHIRDLDAKKICSIKNLFVNLEISIKDEIVKNSLKIKPDYICIVPENRKEITTEGGLNLKKNNKKIKSIIGLFKKKKIRTSLFINPSLKDILFSKQLGADCIEIHTGRFANAIDPSEVEGQLQRLIESSNKAHALDLIVNAGHGINTANVNLLFDVPHLNELNVGHHLISNSIISGIENSVREFKRAMSQYKMQ